MISWSVLGSGGPADQNDRSRIKTNIQIGATILRRIKDILLLYLSNLRIGRVICLEPLVVFYLIAIFPDGQPHFVRQAPPKGFSWVPSALLGSFSGRLMRNEN